MIVAGVLAFGRDRTHPDALFPAHGTSITAVAYTVGMVVRGLAVLGWLTLFIGALGFTLWRSRAWWIAFGTLILIGFWFWLVWRVFTLVRYVDLVHHVALDNRAGTLRNLDWWPRSSSSLADFFRAHARQDGVAMLNAVRPPSPCALRGAYQALLGDSTELDAAIQTPWPPDAHGLFLPAWGIATALYVRGEDEAVVELVRGWEDDLRVLAGHGRSDIEIYAVASLCRLGRKDKALGMALRNRWLIFDHEAFPILHDALAPVREAAAR